MLQYSGLENSMECIVHGVAKSRTGLRDFHVHLSLHHISVFEFVNAWAILEIRTLMAAL